MRIFGRLEYELSEEPISTQDASNRASAEAIAPAITEEGRIEHVSEEGEVEEMNIDSFGGLGVGREDGNQANPLPSSPIPEPALSPPPSGTVPITTEE